MRFISARVPSSMTAIEIKQPGGPEVLVPTTRPVPTPAADQVLIRIHAAAVNGPDVFQRKGLYDPPPGASDIPGLEVAGQVVAVGADVSRQWHRIGPDIGADVGKHTADDGRMRAQKVQLLDVVVGIEQRAALGGAGLMIESKRRALIRHIDRTRAQQVDQP